MKNVLPVMFCLLGISSAFGQVEIKGFVEGQYYQYNILTQNDSSYFSQKDNSLQLRPSFAISFYRIDRAFHEFAVSNINISRQSTDLQNSSSPTIQTNNSRVRMNFRYNYNYCILKASKRWLPYIGVQTNHELGISNSEQGTNQARSSFVISRAGLAAGVQYKIKDRFRLELQMPFNIVQFRYQRQNLVSSQVPSGQILQYVNMNWIQSPVVVIPIRLGAVVQI
ncbi:MAG: hypothetical protein AB8G11_03745 [Saprospiraceae bacterium]